MQKLVVAMIWADHEVRPGVVEVVAIHVMHLGAVWQVTTKGRLSHEHMNVDRPGPGSLRMDREAFCGIGAHIVPSVSCLGSDSTGNSPGAVLPVKRAA